ncbi:MAG: proprotein convertase P-domain-containing protein, partial [Pseudomonadota bacterium]
VWLTMIGDAQTSANEQSVSVDYDEATNGAIAIPDFNSTTSTPGAAMATVTVAQNIQIETILVTVDITHTFGSDLEIYLVNPDGDQIPLFLQDGNSSTMDNGFVWTFEVRTLLGFESAGDWSIAVRDMAGGDVGTINDFQIDFYGSDASNDNIHIISRDFLELTAFDAARMVITDTNGGTDWLNFTGIQSNVVLNLAAGSNFLVGGTVWGSLQAGADVFENAIVGDGNDDVFGNSLANHIYGMRGNDEIYGGDGGDRLYGGENSDRLYGDNGWDYLYGGNGFDRLYGGDQTDRLYGEGGSDRLFGQNDRDFLYGGGDDDYLYGGAGEDRLYGGDGVDRAYGGDDADLIYGGNQGDRLFGGAGSDEIFGEDGFDRAFGGDQGDTIRGGGGGDRLYGDGGNDTLYGDGGDDYLYGGAGGLDRLYGGTGVDRLYGGDGRDQLYGGTWGDRLFGGTGNDRLQGDGGADSFIFQANMDVDTVVDFVINTDLLEFDDVLWASDPTPPATGADVLAEYGSTSGNDVIFDFGSGNMVTLVDALLTGTFNDIANEITII